MPGEQDYDGSGTLILAPEDLKVGMFVSYLDRPWTETGFDFQGFRIESEEDLRELKSRCEYVFVDAPRGLGSDTYGAHVEKQAAQTSELEHLQAGPATAHRARTELSPTEAEFPSAKTAYDALRTAIIRCYEAAGRAETLPRETLARAMRQVVDSVERNPDALLYLMRTKATGRYLYRHAAACAVMLAAFGWHLGMPRPALQSLATGGALLDIGKTRVPADLLEQNGAMDRKSGDMHRLRRHVEHGLQIVSSAGVNDSQVLAIVGTHHERFDGSGYPERRAGDSVSRAGYLGGLVDTFDAMVSEKCYGRRATPYEAMRFLRSRRDSDFPARLVAAFQQAFGTYPTGSPVELSTGEVGFVVQQNPGARLQPRVYLVLDRNKRRIHEFRIVDLSDYAVETGKEQAVISQCLKPGSYGLEC